MGDKQQGAKEMPGQSQNEQAHVRSPSHMGLGPGDCVCVRKRGQVET